MDDRQDDRMLPEGWQEGDVLFEETDSPDVTAISDADGPPTPETQPPIGDGRDGREGAPTPEPTQTDRPNPLRFKARVDRQDRDVELDERELPTLYQKAQVTDRVQAKLSRLSPLMERGESLSRQLGYRGLEHLLDSAQQGLLSPARPAPASAAPPTRDYRQEAQALLAARPQLRGTALPDCVQRACAGGKSLLDAYTDYERMQERELGQRLRRENEILRQNAEAARRAPVRAGQGVGGSPGEDDFLRGFHFDD